MCSTSLTSGQMLPSARGGVASTISLQPANFAGVANMYLITAFIA